MAEHALLSASSAHRWLKCTAAPRLEAQIPESTSQYAEEGTLAHSICELHVQREFNGLKTRSFNAKLKKLQENPLYKDEMLTTAGVYIQYLKEKSLAFENPPYVVSEVKVDFSEYVPEGFGTCDCVMIGGNTLHITDYKHGQGVKVSAVRNDQMRLYALGAWLRYRMFYDIKFVSMAICQPRLPGDPEEYFMPIEELMMWGEEIKPTARRAFDGVDVEFVAGDHCRFCRAKDLLYSRQRKCWAPYGISFTKKSMASASPTDAELANGANWELVCFSG